MNCSSMDLVDISCVMDDRRDDSPVTSRQAPRNVPFLSAAIRASWSTIGPRDTLVTSALHLPRIANSSAPSRCRVCFLQARQHLGRRHTAPGARQVMRLSTDVNGTETTTMSRSCPRNWCSPSLSNPENHSSGMSPSGSPVPGTT